MLLCIGKYMYKISCLAVRIVALFSSLSHSSLPPSPLAPPYIVYTSGAVIYRVNINGSSSATVLNSAGQLKPNKVGIDFDYQ